MVNNSGSSTSSLEHTATLNTILLVISLAIEQFQENIRRRHAVNNLYQNSPSNIL